ncbi:MAG TPA: hypothetical protein DEO70_06355 [Bacteroidales bacterium]|nr:MAG: hypothetical protein A2X11_08400 [Bacteroidetes bacterium GWE2_42_24]OFY30942.1 MAG: hypothetical protein A2X09_17175 [Bacteroidetes bacterium GWF2_43_11]HBZ66442.1 hypothetical protein [Bacteroidales bacterium]
MKKLSGWIIIVLCAIPLLILSLSLVLIVIGLMTGNINLRMPIIEWFGFGLGLLVVLGLFLTGFRKGLKMVRSKNMAVDEDIENLL